MSRLYEALQKSQGEAPSASPLATPAQPDSQVPGAQVPGLPIDNTEALDALATQAPPTASWLAVPAERILRPSGAVCGYYLHFWGGSRLAMSVEE